MHKWSSLGACSFTFRGFMGLDRNRRASTYGLGPTKDGSYQASRIIDLDLIRDELRDELLMEKEDVRDEMHTLLVNKFQMDQLSISCNRISLPKSMQFHPMNLFKNQKIWSLYSSLSLFNFIIHKPNVLFHC
ncbi:hypothetical protein Sjap_008634 [Stephania japonica]|uniref:Uncharacterized protein n=1 Tax=Stephania japonica TaxID=461633 RepID=A0AAP0PET6_9MAGN